MYAMRHPSWRPWSARVLRQLLDVDSAGSGWIYSLFCGKLHRTTQAPAHTNTRGNWRGIPKGTPSWNNQPYQRGTSAIYKKTTTASRINPKGKINQAPARDPTIRKEQKQTSERKIKSIRKEHHPQGISSTESLNFHLLNITSCIAANAEYLD